MEKIGQNDLTEKDVQDIMHLIGFRGEDGTEKYIEQMKEKGFNVIKPTINRNLRRIDKFAEYSSLTQDQVRLLLLLELNPSTLDKIWEDPDFQESFIVKVFNGRIDAYKLGDMVNPKLFVYAIMVFGVDSPGKGNIFLIKLLEHYHKNGTVATKDDLSMDMYPMGFYSDKSCRAIIDYCLKTKATVFSELY